MLDLFKIEVGWDGSRIVLAPVYGQGWELLAGESRPVGKRYTRACAQMSDLDSFTLEAALYTVSREIGDCWEQARREPEANPQLQLVADEDMPRRQ